MVTVVNCFGLLGLNLGPAAGVNLLVNGEFEIPSLALGTYQTIGPGVEPAGFGWTIFSGNVDVERLPIYPFVQYAAFEGGQSLDLNGTQRGFLFQDFPTLPGSTYALSLAYADNPFEGGVSSAAFTMTDPVSNGLLLYMAISHGSSTNGPPASADWQFAAGNLFTATGTLTRLTIASTSISNTASGGIVLDAVMVEGVTADFDADGDVDSSDFLAWQQGLGSAGGATRQQGDANGDGAVRGSDLAVWRAQFAQTSTTAAVPEPATATLATGAILFVTAAPASASRRSTKSRGESRSMPGTSDGRETSLGIELG
jgi:hypothetical protein